MSRNILWKACKLSLMASIAAVVFFGLNIAGNENRFEKIQTFLCGE